MLYLCLPNFDIEAAWNISRYLSQNTLKRFYFFTFLFFLFLNFSWGHFLNLHISAVLSIFLHRYSMVYFSNAIFFFGIPSDFQIFSGFFRIYFKSSDFLSIEHISLQNWCFISQIWYDNLLFRNFIRIFPDFPDLKIS